MRNFSRIESSFSSLSSSVSSPQSLRLCLLRAAATVGGGSAAIAPGVATTVPSRNFGLGGGAVTIVGLLMVIESADQVGEFEG